MPDLPFIKKPKKEDINFLMAESKLLNVRRFALIGAIFALIILVQLLIATGLTFLKIRENKVNEDLEARLNILNQEWQRNSAKAQDLHFVKSSLSLYQDFSAKYPDFREIILSLAQVVPDGVVLADLKIDPQGQVELSGQGNDVRDIYQFVEVLKENPDKFEGVELGNLAKGTGNTYNFSLSLLVK